MQPKNGNILAPTLTPAPHVPDAHAPRTPHAPVLEPAPQPQPQPQPAPAPDFAGRAAHWIHEHPKATQNLPGFLAYQGLRGAVAAVPYGISMGGTLGTMEGLARASEAAAKKALEGSARQKLFERAAQLTRFPAFRTSVLIATSFTLYRGTSKIAKWMHDSLFDPKDSELQTADKIRHLRQDTWAKMKENAPAGIASTPVAAFVLGFVTSTFQKPAKMIGKDGIDLNWTRENYLSAKANGQSGKLMRGVVLDKNAKFIEQAAINTLAYSLFFELGDRLFQAKRQQMDKDAGKPVEQPVPQPKKHYGFFTNEPSLGHFVFRRMLPTAVSIGAYTAFKMRHTYMKIGNFAIKEGEPVLKQVPKLMGIEAAAVLWFFMIPFVSEPWGKVYDRFFNKLEKKAQEKDALLAPPPQAAAVSAQVEAQLPQPEAAPHAKIAQVTSHGKAAAAPTPVIGHAPNA